MKIVMSILLLGALTGCMTYQEARVGDVGETVYAIHRQQIADPARAASPGTEVSPTGIDGAQMETVLEGYRGVAGDASQVVLPVHIDAGN